jgi:hypothetical protein
MTVVDMVFARIINVSAKIAILEKTVHFMNVRIIAINRVHVIARLVSVLALRDSSEMIAVKSNVATTVQEMGNVKICQVNVLVLKDGKEMTVVRRNAQMTAIATEFVKTAYANALMTLSVKIVLIKDVPLTALITVYVLTDAVNANQDIQELFVK